VTATRSAAVVPAPRTRGLPAAEAPTRAELRLVPPRRPTGAVAVVALVLVFGVLLATAALNTLLVSGQRDLDRIEAEIREGEQRNQALRLRVAELESPERIVDAASAAGMVEPTEVRWITVQPDGASAADTAEAPVPAAGPTTDERAEGTTDAGVGDDG
jgi:hypothetical protein